MEHECVTARFLFFNGKERYTIEFAYCLLTWYVFENENTSGALWSKKIDPSFNKSPNRDNAGDILDEYLNRNAHVHPVFKSILDAI